MTPREIFDVVQLAYYVPVLFLGILICLRHGFVRQDGWVYIVLLALLRLIGSSTGIAAVHTPTNRGLLATTIICSNIGLSPLLLALLGFTGRVGRSAVPGPPVSARLMRAAYIPVTVALILAVVAGIDALSDNSDKAARSHTFAKASALLYLLSYLATLSIITLTFAKRHTVRRADTKLLYAGMLALPFIGVRVLYAIVASFDYTDTNTFSVYRDATRPVLVQALLGFLMEVIVVAVYITAALLTPRPEAPGADREVEMTQEVHEGTKTDGRV